MPNLGSRVAAIGGGPSRLGTPFLVLSTIAHICRRPVWQVIIPLTVNEILNEHIARKLA